MNKNILKGLVSAGVLTAVSGAVSAAPLDFSGVTGAISVTEILAAITAVAALKVSPVFAKWAYGKLINWFGN